MQGVSCVNILNSGLILMISCFDWEWLCGHNILVCPLSVVCFRKGIIISVSVEGVHKDTVLQT